MDTNNEDLRRTYFYIFDEIVNNGLAPTIREIAENCFISRSTAMQRLTQLEAWGYITRKHGKERGIMLTNKTLIR